MITRQMVLQTACSVVFLLAGSMVQAQEEEKDSKKDPKKHLKRDISVEADADPPVIPDNVKTAIKKGQEYLKKCQAAGGSIGKNTAQTALATLALMVDGSMPGFGPYGKETAMGMKFLLANSQPSGLLVKSGTSSPMYHHGLATLCLAEIWGMTRNPEVRPVLKKAVELIVRCQNPAGGWRYNPNPRDADLSVTVMQIVALRAAQNAGIAVPAATIKKAIGYAKRCHYKKDGGFGYTERGRSAPPRSAAGVISLQLCGEYECPEVNAGIGYLWKHIDKLEKIGGQHYYFHYYAMQAMYQSRDTAKWREWYPKACKALMSKQGKAGNFGAVYQTGMAILAMGLPYRYLPIYQR